MIAVLHFTMLVITTLFAAGAAALVNWLLLRATFQLMRPATAGRAAGTANSARTYTRLKPIPVNGLRARFLALSAGSGVNGEFSFA